MSSAKRTASLGFFGLGLLLGFLCIGRAVETALDRNPNRLYKRETITAGLLLGVPCTAGALWGLGSLARHRKLMRSERLQALFYKALKANNGKISPIQFAMIGQISVDEAKDCLDTWAIPLNADFQIDEAGVVTYCFNVFEN